MMKRNKIVMAMALSLLASATTAVAGTMSVPSVPCMETTTRAVMPEVMD